MQSHRRPRVASTPVGRRNRSRRWTPPEASISFWINRAGRSLLRVQDRRLRSLGFAMAQMPVLHALADGAACSQMDLARRANVEQPTMAALLTRMERDGIIERGGNPADGRGSLASLTSQARGRLPAARDELVRIETVITRGLTSDEQTLFLQFLQRAIDNLSGVDTRDELEKSRR